MFGLSTLNSHLSTELSRLRWIELTSTRFGPVAVTFCERLGVRPLHLY
jgi:hypothetical protein